MWKNIFPQGVMNSNKYYQITLKKRHFFTVIFYRCQLWLATNLCSDKEIRMDGFS